MNLTEENIIAEIRNCSEIINDYYNFNYVDHQHNYIQFDITQRINLQGLNTLHQYFERIRNKDSGLFKDAPRYIQHTINECSTLIHRLELLKGDEI